MHGYGDPPLVVMLPIGPLVALALLRWRRADARLLFLMACVTRSVTGYAELPLFLVAQTARQSFVLCIGSYIATIVQGAAVAPSGYYNLRLADTAYLMCLYLPAIVLVLRRPNVAADL